MGVFLTAVLTSHWLHVLTGQNSFQVSLLIAMVVCGVFHVLHTISYMTFVYFRVQSYKSPEHIKNETVRMKWWDEKSSSLRNVAKCISYQKLTLTSNYSSGENKFSFVSFNKTPDRCKHPEHRTSTKPQNKCKLSQSIDLLGLTSDWLSISAHMLAPNQASQQEEERPPGLCDRISK